MKKTFLMLFFVAAIVAGYMTGCSDNQNLVNNPTGTFGKIESCDTITYPITAGQNIPCGTMSVWNDNVNVYVKLVTTCDDMGTAHLWIGNDTTLVPRSNGNGSPTPGQFPYQYEVNGGTYTFTIPLEDVIVGMNDYCNVKLFIFAHMEVGTETAWGGTIQGWSERWYYYDSYIVCCEEYVPPTPTQNQTAFAKVTKGTSNGPGFVWTTDKKSNPETPKYPSINLTKNRWGWAGKIEDGTFTYDLWAGAGLNDTTKGVKAGTVTVTKSGTSVSVTYNCFSGFTMQEVHVYVSVNQPTTIAPGQFGNTVYFNPNATTYTDTYTLENASQYAWIIAHAVVTN